MSDLRSHQNNEHVAQLLSAAFTNPSRQSTHNSNRNMVASTSMPSRTPKPAHNQSVAKISSGLSVNKQRTQISTSNGIQDYSSQNKKGTVVCNGAQTPQAQQLQQHQQLQPGQSRQGYSSFNVTLHDQQDYAECTRKSNSFMMTTSNSRVVSRQHSEDQHRQNQNQQFYAQQRMAKNALQNATKSPLTSQRVQLRNKNQERVSAGGAGTQRHETQYSTLTGQTMPKVGGANPQAARTLVSHNAMNKVAIPSDPSQVQQMREQQLAGLSAKTHMNPPASTMYNIDGSAEFIKLGNKSQLGSQGTPKYQQSNQIRNQTLQSIQQQVIYHPGQSHEVSQPEFTHQKDTGAIKSATRMQLIQTHYKPDESSKENTNSLPARQLSNEPQNIAQASRSASQGFGKNISSNNNSQQISRSTSARGQSYGGCNISEKNRNTQTPQVSVKVFDGLEKAVSQTVVPRVANNNFQGLPMPTCLKKLSVATQNYERYLHKINTNTKSERTITKSSEKPNQQSLASGDINGALFRSMDCNSLPDDTCTLGYGGYNQAILRSLEVLEECSNEDNSPAIREKKAGAMKRCSSSPTNFINISGRKSGAVGSFNDQSKAVLPYNQITLCNQKDVPPIRMPGSPRSGHTQQNFHLSERDEQLRILLPCVEGITTSSSQMVDTSQFVQLTCNMLELQQQMNSGVFIGGVGNNSSNNLQPQLQSQHNQLQQQAQQPSSVSSHPSISGAIMQQQQHQQPSQWKHQQMQQMQQQQQEQMLQQQHQHSNNNHQQQAEMMNGHHGGSTLGNAPQQFSQTTSAPQQMGQSQPVGNVMPFRGVTVNGQIQPPHLSQQAQQMLQHKLQIQQNAGQSQQQAMVVRYSHQLQQQQADQQQQQIDSRQGPQNSKAQTQKVQQQQYVQGSGQKGARALTSATSNKHKPIKQQLPQQQQQKLQQRQANEAIFASPSQQTMHKQQGISPGQPHQQMVHQQLTASPGVLRPGSNHRVLVPFKQQQDTSSQFQLKATLAQEQPPARQPTAPENNSTNSDQLNSNSQKRLVMLSSGSGANTNNEPQTKPDSAPSTGVKQGTIPAAAKQPRTYKEIRQRLHQQQQMQQLRLQQQQWIQRQQQILLSNNPGATIEQVNAIIQQSIINQQQQMALQQQQAHLQALQQASQQLMKSPHPNDMLAQQTQQQQQHPSNVFPNGSLSAASQGQQQQSTVPDEDDPSQQRQPQIVRLTKRQTANLNTGQGGLVGNTGNNQQIQQVQIKQHANGQVSMVHANQGQQQNNLQNTQPGNVNQNQSSVQPAQQRSQISQLASNQNLVSHHPQQHGHQPAQSTNNNNNNATSQKNNNNDKVSSAQTNNRDDNLMSYAQLLKNECQYDGGPSGPSLAYKPNSNQQNLQPSNMPLESLKHTLQQLTSEILRKVLARSDSMNQLRQIIDLKAKKVKPKNYESSIFQTIMDKEQTRVKQEADSLAKQGLRVEDKTLVKYLRGQVKKMLKPFRGLQYDDYLNNEIHLNEIMATQDQQNDPIKESRKRHLRILDAALKEQVVDIHIVLGICVQISRQAFYNELNEYFACAYDYIMANQASFQQHDIQGIVNLKKKLGSVRSNSKVQIQTTKKLDRMFWLLLEQNQEVRNNIRTYKERYNEKADGTGSQHGGNDGQGGAGGASGSSTQGGGNHLSSASHLRRGQNNLRSSSGINTASPKVNAGGSSQNIFASQNQKGHDASVRRTVQKGGRSSNLQQESYNGGKQNGAQSNTHNNNKPALSQSQDASDGINLHATAGKGQQLSFKNGGKNQLAPIPSNLGKKAQSLIQKKMKARDLDRQLNSQMPPALSSTVEKTPDQSAGAKKRRMSSTKGVVPNTQLLSTHQSQTSGTPQNFHPGRSRTKQLHVINSSGQHQGPSQPVISSATEHSAAAHRGSASNNSTEQLFNLIQATKTKNTMILEPLAKRHSKNDSQGVQRAETNQEFVARDEIGSGLHVGHTEETLMSQKSHRMRATDYSRGFMSNLDMENAAKAEMDPNHVVAHKAGDNTQSPSKVFRSWSRPQISSNDLPDMPGGAAAHQDPQMKLSDGKVLKTMQVCTCARFRKRIEQTSAMVDHIKVSQLKTNNDEGQHAPYRQANSVTTKSDLGLSPDHPRLRNSAIGGNANQAPGTPGMPEDYANKSENKGRNVKPQRQDEAKNAMASPNDRRNQPRMSQDFKMRILTKKKVAVPPSAASQQSRSQFNQSNASSQSLEQQNKILNVNRQQFSGEESVNPIMIHSGLEIPSTFIGDKITGSVLQKSKIVTYELCQECGGQRPAGLPQVTSSLSEIKVKLQVGKVSNYNSGSDNDEEFPGTARLNDSKRSSTLSIGYRDGQSPSGSAKRPQQDNKAGQQQTLTGGNINLERVQPTNLINRLNKRYLTAIGVFSVGVGLNSQALYEFIANSRATRLQNFIQDRQAMRIFAAQIIQHRWKLHKKSHDAVMLRMAKLQHLRKKVAINRIYEFHRLIKVRKVTASALLIQQQLWQQVQESQDTYGERYQESIIQIQRKWRAILSQRYILGKSIVAQKLKKQHIWHSIMKNKYRKIQCVESNHIHSETFFLREKRNLECYFWKQQVNYAKDLETRAAKIEQRLNSDFVLADWHFDTTAREWQNTRQTMTIKLEKNEPSQVTVLRDKLVQFYVSNQLPSEQSINRQLDEFVDGRTAMMKALKKEQDYKKKLLLQRIKRQRLVNLFTDEPDIQVEQV